MNRMTDARLSVMKVQSSSHGDAVLASHKVLQVTDALVVYGVGAGDALAVGAVQPGGEAVAVQLQALGLLAVAVLGCPAGQSVTLSLYNVDIVRHCSKM
jgi:hypothetical protein